MLLMTSMAFSQAIQVDVTTYSVPELVNSILINSPCTSANNINWKTGTSFGSENGIGYFENTNPNFPMENGIILTTGNALNAPGPNISELSDGNANWPGDTDLETVLRNSGIEMASVNATVLEFDFTPISSTFSFDFLFASEEYGNFQCDFSDAFAFLLTNLNTGVTTNLAVVPNTNLPISVLTIRDFLYNSLCDSANPQYFGRFNGGAAADASAINYNGQTVLLQASSVLTPNTPYHIKLVIADRTDYQYDSAIFIAASSFNLGQEVLGVDLTLENNSAICFGERFTLETGLDPSEYSFSWKRNNSTIPGQNGPDLEISTPGTYTVTYTSLNLPCNSPVTDSIIVQYYPEFMTPSPSAIYKCDIGATSYDFDLTYNTPILLEGLPAGTSVSYHSSQTEAENDQNELPATFSGNGTETIYARIENTIGCYTIKSFSLALIQPPTAGTPQPMTECAVSFNSPNGSFNFEEQNTAVLNGSDNSIYTITYHSSQPNAQGGIDPLSSTAYLGTDSQTIYARIENKTDKNCFAISSFEIFVKDLPPVDILPNVVRCEEYILPALTNGNYFTMPNGGGTPLFAGNVIIKSQTIYIYNESGGDPNCPNQSSFRVTIIDPDEITPDDTEKCNEYRLPRLQFGNYFTEAGGNGTMIPFGTLITDSQTVYVYYQYPESPFCIVDTNFSITIIDFEELPDFENIFDCDSYQLPTLSNGNYYDRPNGQGNIIPQGRIITTSTKIYVYAENRICKDSKSFEIFIGLQTPANAENCSSYTLPNLAVGNYFTGPAGTGTQLAAGTIIHSSQRIYIYVDTPEVPNCTDNIFFDVTISDPFTIIPNDVAACGKYILPGLTIGNYFTGPLGTGTALLPGAEITRTQRIYIYKRPQPGQNCTNEISYLVTVTPYPKIDARGNIGPICKTYTLTPLSVGNYYSSPDGVGPIPAGTVITQSQRIYIYATASANALCASQSSFTIEIINIEVDTPAPVIACESYVLPSLNVGNYFTQQNGLGTQIPAGEIIRSSQTLYIYAQIISRGVLCADEHPFNITIVKKPVINSIPIATRTICDNDAVNDGFTNLGTDLESAALGTQPASEYSVAFYASEAEANAQINPITVAGTQTIWIRISSLISADCFTVGSTSITVLLVPEPTPLGGIVCINSETNQSLKTHTIQTGLSMATHTFQWFNQNGPIAGAVQNSYTATLPGFYTVIARSRATGCYSNPATVEVKQSEPARVSVTVTDSFFDEHQTITVTATGVGGDYEFQLDDGAFQSSNVFYNVSSGEHLITIRDKNGCEDSYISAFVVNYPKFFTPNGDGINETWNITDLDFQPESYINIFDRYGKFIEQIKPSGKGWDGNYNGKPHFSTDYWFVVYYTEKGVTKTFRAHFTLKR